MCAPMPSFTKKKIGAITGPNLSVLDNMRKVTWLLPNTLSLKQMSPKLVSLVLIQWAGHVRKQNWDMYFRYGDTGSSISKNVKNPARNGGATFKFSKKCLGLLRCQLGCVGAQLLQFAQFEVNIWTQITCKLEGFSAGGYGVTAKSRRGQ